jgi:hypothetical protein
MDTTVNPPVPKYGMHESYQSYQDCSTRNRNMGLYIADRAAQGNLVPARASSIYTRQNNNGNRNGFECPEERDYYPYWHPSQWKDVAILASNTQLCDFYKANSQNVQSKGFCQNPSAPGIQTSSNNQADCIGQGNQWVQQAPFGLNAPDCQQVPWSRENQLGNGPQGFANTYNWTIPNWESCANSDTCVCVLRLRYNISTNEDGYPTMSRPDNGFIDWTYNANASVVMNNPIIPITPDSSISAMVEYQLAADTTQFGRTFQDRSHTFKISKRPVGISNKARIYNLNVRGKRGNIVQTYPATEYDFVPQYLYTRVGDYIHFQWTGCDTNPAGNAGEGTDGTDRTNIAQITGPAANQPATDSWIASNPSKVLFTDPNLRLRFITLDQTGCLPASQLNNNQADVRNCGKLNADNAIYFDGGVIRMNKTGTYYYMNTRNHNFSNRDQKGIIYVVPLLPPWAVGVVITGAVLFGLAAVVAGLMFYAKSHPHSGVANLFSKM